MVSRKSATPPHVQAALPHQPQSAASARQIARDALRSWGLEEEVVERALLIVSELVTNSLEHALPPITLHLTPWRADDTIHIAVADGGPAPKNSTMLAKYEQDEHGRGAFIVEFLSTAWGMYVAKRRVTHWADVPAHDLGSAATDGRVSTRLRDASGSEGQAGTGGRSCPGSAPLVVPAQQQ
ncbi:ATP-binding protein [Streptomyces sp. DH10]|uniref:ATP-binding protein n=1 Tax=Streptomyces sp. DH10 TaxID=3040121 RepID=UPI003FA6B474